MTDEATVPTSKDPSGNDGPIEHGPPHLTRGERRTIASAVWGGIAENVNAEHGQDVTGWDPQCKMYGYGKNYGLNGCQHPGMDIGLDIGTDLFAAVGGIVVFAGPDRFYAPNHVNILTDDREVHIYGHMSSVSSSVRVDDRVDTGQFLGKSGTQNGPHLHFERRVPGNCTSGYCAVEVDSVLVGGGGGAPPAGFAVGELIKVIEAPLRMREVPGLGGAILDELELDVELRVGSSPRQADGFAWYAVSRTDSGLIGWVAGKFCEPVEV